MTDQKPPRLAQGREHVVATVDEIPPGTHKLVPIGRHGVGVYNVNGNFYAIANYCPHEGGPLGEGTIEGGRLVCPWHAYAFDVKTGSTDEDPDVKADVLEAKVENGELRAKL